MHTSGKNGLNNKNGIFNLDNLNINGGSNNLNNNYNPVVTDTDNDVDEDFQARLNYTINNTNIVD